MTHALPSAATASQRPAPRRGLPGLHRLALAVAAGLAGTAAAQSPGVPAPQPAASAPAAAAEAASAPAAAGAASAPAEAAAPAAPVVPGSAASAPVAATGQLPVVRVRAAAESATGPVSGYRARRSATATKTDTPLSETPQSITVVTADQIIDQGAGNVQDALNYAAGVRSDAYGLDSRTDSVRIRGAYPDEYLDGLRKTFGYYTSNARTEPYTLERIEVLRGPSAMLFGQGTTGGVVNLVSKRPQAEAQQEAGLQVGSWNRRQLQADLTGPLTDDGQWLYRVVAVVRESDTQVDHVPDDRRLLAPSLTWRPDGATSVTLQALWQEDRSGSTSQFFPWIGTILPNPNGPIPSNRFIGEPGVDHYDTDRQTLGWLFERRLDERWTVRQNLRYSKNELDYGGFYGDAFGFDGTPFGLPVFPPGDWTGDPVNKRLLGRFAYVEQRSVRMLGADQHLEGRIDSGDVKHHLLLGLDVADSDTSLATAFDFPEYMGGGVPLIDVYNPVYGGYTLPAASAQPGSSQKHLGLYLQDQMKVGANWSVVAGLRHDRTTSSTEGAASQKASATTKRLGAIYAAGGGWSPFLSYSESFTPQADRVGGGINFSFTPTRGKQWETGVKYEPADADLSFNASVYDLRETDKVISVGTFGFTQGATQARGLELEAKARLPHRTELTAHYNYIDVEADDPSLRIESLPRHQAAVWSKWQFDLQGRPGFSAGAGVRYMSSFKDGAAPQIPSLTLLDALLAWDSPAWRVALNINNVTDKIYFATCLERGDCWFGARRNAVATVTYRW
jgi:iron complex outermembrane receptor protein